jgi:hypothetical protein
MTTKEHAIAILKTGYGLKLLHAAGDYTAPFFWGLPPQLGVERKLNHGSIFFLNCGDEPFAITAAHVYKAYLGNKADNHSVLAQIGDLRFIPEERLIDRDDVLDLATFRIYEREIRTIDKNVHVHPEPLWPPLPPKVGQGVFYAGFPLTDRSLRDWKSLDFGLHAALLTATAVDSRKIVVSSLARIGWMCTELVFPRRTLGSVV